MPKRIANGLTLLSAVVCVGSLALLTRSRFRVDGVTIPFNERAAMGAYTVDGRLLLWHQRFAKPTYARILYSNENAAQLRLGQGEFWREIAKIRWLSIGWYATKRHKFIMLPLWLFPLLTAIPPVRWWRARRREGGRGFAVDGADHGVRAHGTRADGTGAGGAD
jgi:hypothetical protein